MCKKEVIEALKKASAENDTSTFIHVIESNNVSWTCKQLYKITEDNEEAFHYLINRALNSTLRNDMTDSFRVKILLHYTIRRKDLRNFLCIRDIIDKTCSKVTYKCSIYNSLFAHACVVGYIPIIDLLNPVGSYYKVGYNIACRAGNLELVKYMDDRIITRKPENYSNLYLHADGFVHALYGGNIDMAVYFINTSKITPSVVTYYRGLTYAVIGGNLKAVKFAMDLYMATAESCVVGGMFSDQYIKYINHLLTTACNRGYMDIIEYLLDIPDICKYINSFDISWCLLRENINISEVNRLAIIKYLLERITLIKLEYMLDSKAIRKLLNMGVDHNKLGIRTVAYIQKRNIRNAKVKSIFLKKTKLYGVLIDMINAYNEY